MLFSLPPHVKKLNVLLEKGLRIQVNGVRWRIAGIREVQFEDDGMMHIYLVAYRPRIRRK